MKKAVPFILVLITLANVVLAQKPVYQLSSHVLDISNGQAAPGIRIVLSKQDAQQSWKVVAEKTTNDQGRVTDFLPERGQSNTGIYRLRFYTAPYFKAQNLQCFYPFIDVVFEISDTTHYHVPITLSPFGYATYRGN